MTQNGNDNELNKIMWDAFVESGKPGYYMLYQALSGEEKEE